MAVSITIVGCGPGSPDYVTPAAVRAVEDAEVLVGAQRLLDLFAGCNADKVATRANIRETLDRIASLAQTRSVAVLVSGDPGLFSLARRVVAQFGRESCLVIPGVSSVQVAFARLGLDWADARIISAHKQNPEPAIEETLRDENKLAILAGRDAALVWISNLLRKLGTGYGIFVCENLTLDNERIRKVAAEELPLLRAGSSTVVLIIRDSAWE